MRDKLIELLKMTPFRTIEEHADYLVANHVTILDDTEKPKIIKRDFSFDSKVGWYMTMQLQWMGQKWFICQQIPNEPREYIDALIKQSMKEE